MWLLKYCLCKGGYVFTCVGSSVCSKTKTDFYEAWQVDRALEEELLIRNLG